MQLVQSEKQVALELQISSFVVACFTGQELQKQISHIDQPFVIGRCAMCILWFFWPELQRQISAYHIAHRPTERNRLMFDMHLVISGQKLQAHISHIEQQSGIGWCSIIMNRYASCDFMANRYKRIYRTSSNRTESIDMCDMHRNK
jgi:hypothetical protein